LSTEFRPHEEKDSVSGGKQLEVFLAGSGESPALPLDSRIGLSVDCRRPDSSLITKKMVVSASLQGHVSDEIPERNDSR